MSSHKKSKTNVIREYKKTDSLQKDLQQLDPKEKVVN